MPLLLRVLYVLLAGGAAGGGAYVGGFLEPYGYPSPFQEPAAETMATGTGVQPQESTQAEGAQPTLIQSEEPAAPEAVEDIKATFDIVRAAPDGSLVVAGQAAPNVTVELHSDGRVIGSVRTDGSGAFAIVLDQPLPPGDHTIVPVIRRPDGQTVASNETAIVRIPDRPGGETLALVATDGEASRVLDAGSAMPSLLPGEQTAAFAVPEPVLPDMPGAEVPPAPSVSPSTMADAIENTVPPQADFELPWTAPGVAAGTVTTDRVARLEANPVLPNLAPVPDVRVTIDAVEVEGETVFIGGQAAPNARIRIYAGELYLGEAIANGGGRYLLQESLQLPSGAYDIRADLIAGDEVVLSRTMVPFQRPEAEDFATLAVPQADFSLGNEPPQFRFEEVSSSVIIRRGDTLWQIARRVYGQGIRFSTIYNANANTISDPNRIWPGQVFAVPGQTEEGEPLNRDAMDELLRQGDTSNGG